MTWLLDLDGVVWTGTEPIAGSADAIAALRAGGERVGYVTNNSATVEHQMTKLGSMGVDAGPDDLVNGPAAVATMLEPGWRVLCCAIEGMRAPLEERGVEVVMVDDVDRNSLPEVDAVVVSIRPEGDMHDLSLAVRSVLQCRRLFAPSADPLYPVADGFDMGGGALTTAVAYATGVTPEFAGKPFAPMTNAVRERFTDIRYVVGDQVRTDGGLAARLGVPFVLVDSGVSALSGRADDVDVPIAYRFDDLAHAVDSLL